MPTALMERPQLAPHDTETCPNNTGWLRGRCRHGNERWIKLSCKRRDCPYCGTLRKRRIATRIYYGLQELGKAAWFVGTFDKDVPKDKAVLVQKHFIQWLRRDQGIKVEYAAVWEVTKQGRLHLNLILAPWTYLKQAKLSVAWQNFGGGPVVWIEKVDPAITREVTKTYNKLGNYLAKFEQMVTEGRGINYSKGWPKAPQINIYHRKAPDIEWTWIRSDYAEAEEFEIDRDRGTWAEILAGEYSLLGQHEDCDCFDWHDYSPDRPRINLTGHRRPREQPP